MYHTAASTRLSPKGLLFASLVVVLAPAIKNCTDRPTLESQSQPRVQVNSENSLPPIGETYSIEITGIDNRWHVRYPGLEPKEGDGLAARDIHVPCNTKIVLVLKSRDFAYMLALPHYGTKEIAIPSLTFQMEFLPTESGRFEMVGNQWCGDVHPELQRQLVVEPRDEFARWLGELRSDPAD